MCTAGAGGTAGTAGTDGTDGRGVVVATVKRDGADADVVACGIDLIDGLIEQLFDVFDATEIVG